jgi:hypothetical protein
MGPLAAAVARLHAVAEPRRDHGGRDGMRWVIEGNRCCEARVAARLLGLE